MNRRMFLAASGAALVPRGVVGAPRRPNIVLILADDLGYGELGFQGNRQIPTPHLDSIAASGVRFTNAYVSSPYCAPSRAGLLTGRYQTRFGHERNFVGKQNLDPKIGLPPSEVTLASVLQSAGYVTGCFGKWHLGGAPQFHPLRRGFDEFYGFLHEGHFYLPPPYRGGTTRLRPNEPPYDDDNPILRGTEPVEEREYLTQAITREALRFIDAHRARPFFLYVSYNAIHSPMQAPTDYMRRFNGIGDEHRQVFAAMLAAMDDGVGSILARLRERGLEEGTLVIFLSDNGGPTAELTSSNHPLRGGKGQLWEGGIRVPFAVRWKGRVPEGKTLDHPIIALDLFPTVLAAAGVPAPPGQRLDGVDLLPLLSGQSAAAPHESLFWRYANALAIRRGPWKLIRQPSPPSAQDAPFGLYHLGEDIGESRDLAASRPDVVASLRTELDRWNAEMIPPLW